MRTKLVNLSPETTSKIKKTKRTGLVAYTGGTLLLPRPALMHSRRNDLSGEEIQQYYQVSEEMLTWRFRMTGVDCQLSHR